MTSASCMIAMNAERSSARQGRIDRRAVSRPNKLLLVLFRFLLFLARVHAFGHDVSPSENNGNAPRALMISSLQWSGARPRAPKRNEHNQRGAFRRPRAAAAPQAILLRAAPSRPL